MSLFLRITSLAAVLFIVGCAQPIKQTRAPEPIPFEVEEKEQEYVEEKKEYDSNVFTLFYQPHMTGHPQDIIDFLSENENRRLTLIFPANYFEPEYRQPFIEKFRVFVTSGQIEIGLTLDNEPILPLLADLELGGEGVSNWGFDFKWPTDIAHQIAKGSSIHQKRWGTLPGGFVPPYFSLSPQTIKSLKQFRLAWVLGKSAEFGGIEFYGSTTLIVPAAKEDPIDIREGTDIWAEQLNGWIFNQPFAFVNGNSWKRSRSEKTFLAHIGKSIDEFEGDFLTAQEFSEIVEDDSYPLQSEYEPFQTDFSEWVLSDAQRRAWKALSEAREVIETYKNSGRANLRRLDAATEEILTAESGTFLHALGQSEVPLTLNKRSFIATLDNIYRLCGVPIPKKLNRTFSKTNWRKTTRYKNKSNEPFFVKEDQSFIWNDPKGDDFGWGKITYPVGSYSKGSFDLRQFKISWDETKLKLSSTLYSLPKKERNSVLPLIDVYIDVNRLSGAGSDAALVKRGPVLIDRDAAWEYAISMGPNTAILYQSIPGSKARKIKTFTPTINQNAKSFSVAIPRSSLRGNPSQWRVSVAVMGSEVIRAQQSEYPISILAQATQRNFGGASSTGQIAPTFIDILAETTQEQVDMLKNYATGRKITLPFVEAE